MKKYTTLTPGDAPSAVALGCFDGVHVGHRQVIAAALEAGLCPTVLTFESGLKTGGSLASPMQKEELLRAMGVRQAYFLPFPLLRNLSPEEFVDEVLDKICRAKLVCCGFNFHFGCGGSGDAQTLRTLCAARGILTEIVPEVLVDGETVSSTRIRALISEGRVGEAGRLLGRPYGFDFPVVHGRQLGRTMGTPTLNQRFPEGFTLPRFGVYASVTMVHGACFYAVTNVGVKPTVGSDAVLAETWIPDYIGGELYGEILPVELLKFIRPEQKFADMDALRDQIQKDAKAACRIFSEPPGL